MAILDYYLIHMLKESKITLSKSLKPNIIRGGSDRSGGGGNTRLTIKGGPK